MYEIYDYMTGNVLAISATYEGAKGACDEIQAIDGINTLSIRDKS